MTTNKAPGGGGGGSTKVDFSDVPSIGSGCSGNCDCSSVQELEKRKGDGNITDAIRQLALDGSSPTGPASFDWAGTIFIQPAEKQISVATNILARNLTRDPLDGHPGIPLNDSQFLEKCNAAASAIRAWWNARPYKIKITFDASSGCGATEFRVRFDPRIYTSERSVSGNVHYRIKFYNSPGANYSEIGSISHTGWINFSQSTGSTDRREFSPNPSMTDTLEPHEYGHMLGIRDLYYNDKKGFNGAQFTFRGDGSNRVERHNDKGIVQVSGQSPDAQSVPPAQAPVRGGLHDSHGCMMGHAKVTNIYPLGYVIPLGYAIKRLSKVNIESWEIMS